MLKKSNGNSKCKGFEAPSKSRWFLQCENQNKVESPPITKKRNISIKLITKIRDCKTKRDSRAELAKELFMLFFICVVLMALTSINEHLTNDSKNLFYYVMINSIKLS